MENSLIYNSTNSTYMKVSYCSIGVVCELMNKYGTTISKNLKIDLNKDNFDVSDIIDYYENVYLILDNYELDDVNNIRLIKRKLSYIGLLNCSNLYIDSKIIDKVEVFPKCNILPVVDYRYVNIFKKELYKLFSGKENENNEFKKIIVYIRNKILWPDVIYDFKDYTSNLDILISEKDLYLSSQAQPYSDIRNIDIIRQLWTTFKVNIIVYENTLGYEEKIISNEEERPSELIIDEESILKDMDIYEDDTILDIYGIYNKDFQEDNEEDYDKKIYEYEVIFDENDNPVLNKKEFNFCKTEELSWVDIINRFINNTPNIYRINSDLGQCNIYPSELNTISDYKPTLANIVFIKNSNNKYDAYRILMEHLIFLDSLEDYCKAFIEINKSSNKV